MRAPTPLIRHVSILSTLVAGSALVGTALAAPEPLARLMPDVRLVGWHGVERRDARHLHAAAERDLTPLDRGLALYLSWALQPLERPSPARLPRDGQPAEDDRPFTDGDIADDLARVDPLAELEAEHGDPWADPDDDWLGDTWPPPGIAPEGPGAASDGARAQRPIQGSEASGLLPIVRRAHPDDLPTLADRLAALQAARRAWRGADGPRAGRRARIDLDEARARVELVDPRFRGGGR